MKAFQAASEPLCHRPASYFSFYIRETESALPLWFTPQILCYNPKRDQEPSPALPGFQLLELLSAASRRLYLQEAEDGGETQTP